MDTVLLAIADMEGRLQGKRLTATHFLEEVAENVAEGCNYLLAVDVDMETVSGYEMSSWSRGYGDFVMKPDLDTLRPVPWHEATVMVMADLQWHDGADVVASPRQILRRQLARLAERGWSAAAGTELEFMLFHDTYEDAWRKSYRDLEPVNLYNVDYSLVGTARVEPLIRRIRNSMQGAGMRVENSKGECNFGQHEINFRYDEALKTADDHALYKTGAKEIAAQEGYALTFMAKLNEHEGNSCHIHCSLQKADGSGSVFAEQQQTFDHFVAGQLAALSELTLLFAPQVNSYKRFVEGSFAPTAVAWGRDNRTCAMRVVGHGEGLRVENRLPGADVNPYLGAGGDDRRRAARDRRGAAARGAAGGQRLRVGQGAGAAHALRRARPVRGIGAGARGLRPGGGGSLREPRHGGARRLREGHHRLGEVPRLRAPVSRPVIGICSAMEVVRWRAWEVLCNISPRVYSEAVQAAGGLAVVLPPDDESAESPDETLDLLDGLVLAGGADVDPATYGGRAPSRDRRHLAGARSLRAGAGAPGAREGHPPARHLPWRPDAERGSRRHHRPAPPGRARA